MTHVVLFGSSRFDPVWTLLSFLLSCGSSQWVRILRAETCGELNYTDVDMPTEALRSRLVAGEICSLQAAQADPSTLFGLYAPQFCGELWNQWHCVAEGSEENAECIYRLCKKAREMTFVSRSLEEAPEVEHELVTVETFPWDYWRLKVAAVRRTDGIWEERTGHAV